MIIYVYYSIVKCALKGLNLIIFTLYKGRKGRQFTDIHIQY